MSHEKRVRVVVSVPERMLIGPEKIHLEISLDRENQDLVGPSPDQSRSERVHMYQEPPYFNRWNKPGQQFHEPANFQSMDSEFNSHAPPSAPREQVGFITPQTSMMDEPSGALVVAGPRNDLGRPKVFDFTPEELQVLYQAMKDGKTYRDVSDQFSHISIAKFKTRFYRIKNDMKARGQL